MAGALVVSLKIPLTWHISQDSLAWQRPLIVFVHHYRGNSHTTKKYSQLLLDLGYSSVSFTLPYNGTPTHFMKPWNVSTGWADEISKVLEQVGNTQKKVIFSFSGPGASTLHEVASRFDKNNFDVIGLIFDSGPFMNAVVCTRNLVGDFFGVKNPVLREIRLAYMMFIWGFNHDQKLARSVATIAGIEPELPVLSIRSIDDALVPLDKIEQVFSHSFTKLEVLNLSGDHLSGLREHPEEYKNAVKRFLERVSQK